jgi:transmembrane sensor
MNHERGEPEPDSIRIQREAREWHTLINSGSTDVALRRSFESWLQSNRAHKQAYFELEQMWRDIDYAGMAAGVDVGPAMHASRNRSSWLFPRGRLIKWNAGAGITALASICLLVLGLRLYTPAGQANSDFASVPQYVTAVGELREIILEDGSVITLGPKSGMDVTYTADSRNVLLAAGEAFFDVAPDPKRPFFVSADETLIRVVGTKFDVKRTPGDVHVSVLEGIVDVMKPSALAPDNLRNTGAVETKRLLSGQKLIAAATLPNVKDIEQALPGAWRSGRLAYEDASLTEIVADINRYSSRPVRLADPGAGDLRLTTAFQSSEIETWLDLLGQTQGFAIEDQGRDEIVIR